jgi:hypothetical protein
MARRNNPVVTFAMFLGLVGFGYASYHFIYVKGVFAQESHDMPPMEEMEKIRHAIEDTLGSDECFGSMSAFNWRETSKRYRVDISMNEGCSMAEAKRLSKRVSEIVQRASTNKYEAEVSMLVLGREVWHYVP